MYIVRLPTLRQEAAEVAERLATAHREGHAWADMSILCRHHGEMDLCAEVLRQRKLPHQVRRNSSSVFDPAHDAAVGDWGEWEREVCCAAAGNRRIR